MLQRNAIQGSSEDISNGNIPAFASNEEEKVNFIVSILPSPQPVPAIERNEEQKEEEAKEE